MATKHLSTNAPVWAPFAFYGILAAIVALIVEG